MAVDTWATGWDPVHMIDLVALGLVGFVWARAYCNEQNQGKSDYVLTWDAILYYQILKRMSADQDRIDDRLRKEIIIRAEWAVALLAVEANPGTQEEEVAAFLVLLKSMISNRIGEDDFTATVSAQLAYLMAISLVVGSTSVLLYSLGTIDPEPTSKVAFLVGGTLALTFLMNEFSVTPVSGNNVVEDNDTDGINNTIELLLGSNANSNDTDGDGFSDDIEVFYGFDLNDPSIPLASNWYDTTYAPPSNSTFETNDVNGLDRVLPSYRSEWNNGGAWNQLSSVNITGASSFSYEMWADNYYPGPPVAELLEWTDYKFVFQKQLNVSGTEWVNVTTKYAYMHDNDDGGPDDTDGDGLPDYYETKIGTTVSGGGASDTDSDGVDDGDEVLKWGTNPFKIDTDSDGIDDDDETSFTGANFPTEAYRSTWDPDLDGKPNWIDFDSDNDGLNDSHEDTNLDGNYDVGIDVSDLFDSDTDNDGLTDGTEYNHLTNITDDDTDGDGFNDLFEFINGLSPWVPDIKDWVLRLRDNFDENEDVYDIWTDISTQGSARRGGLATTTVYNNEEADEDYEVRVFYETRPEGTLGWNTQGS
jgi:hypothetical protein